MWVAQKLNIILLQDMKVSIAAHFSAFVSYCYFWSKKFLWVEKTDPKFLV